MQTPENKEDTLGKLRFDANAVVRNRYLPVTILLFGSTFLVIDKKIKKLKIMEKKRGNF